MKVRSLIVVIWLCFLAWFVRYEAFPERFTHSLTGYESLLSRDVLVMDSWMRILFNGTAVGYSHTSLESDETDPAARYTVMSDVHLMLSLMGEKQRLSVSSSAALDATYRLQKFDFILDSASSTMNLKAVRVKGTRFRVKMNTGQYQHTSNVVIPDDAVLYSPLTEMAMKRLAPGESLRIRTIDPASMSPIDVVVTAVRREPLSLGTNRYDTTLLRTEYLGMAVSSWMNSDGRILRQETPFGWTLEKCSPEEAMAVLETAGDNTDLLAEMAVPCRGKIAAPRSSKCLRLRLAGVEFARDDLERSPRQTVESIDADSVTLTVMSADTVTRRPGPTLGSEQKAAYLRSSPYIQSDHPKLRRTADSVTRGMATPREKADAIHRWVHRKVAKEMSAGLPSALDVLHTLSGDCNEHTYLFVALARAAGLPAKVVVGLAYHEGAFYYHAWPSVYIDGWFEMDPTWGQEAVDATHIALIEGELASQLQLARVMGKLEIEVLQK